MNKKPKLYPSLICSNLYNLQEEIGNLKKVGVQMVHVDIIDGHFSPSMPLGLETIAQMRKNTDMKMDVHIMSNNNEFFIKEMLKIGCERICFHVETTPHVDYILNMIKKSGVKTGIALKPATPVNLVEEIVGYLDFILLMLINPGYAGDSGEKQVPYALKKVESCRKMLLRSERDIPIEVDGRVTMENIPMLWEAGANEFVGGTGTFFKKGNTLMENKIKIDTIFEGLSGGEEK